MSIFSRKTVNRLMESTGYRISKFRDEPTVHADPLRVFNSLYGVRLNARRQEHLASLGLPIAGKTVLEVGAGPGEHTHFFLDRGCKMLVTEIRAENLELLKQRYPEVALQPLDLENPQLEGNETFDVVYCYGLLYHLGKPDVAIEFMAGRCRGILLLETCVSPGDDSQINLIREDPEEPSQAFHGKGCRPTRPWIFAELKKHFPHVYLTRTQPCHEQFPIDWTIPPRTELVRSVFVASRTPLANERLSDKILATQVRH